MFFRSPLKYPLFTPFHAARSETSIVLSVSILLFSYTDTFTYLQAPADDVRGRPPHSQERRRFRLSR